MKMRLLTLVASALAALTLISPASAVGTGASFKGPVGVQLYSLRGLFLKNGVTTMDLVKTYGVKEVELGGTTYGLTPEQLRQEVEKRGLVAISGHFPYARVRDEPEKVAAEAKALGLRYAGCASIPHEGKYTAAQARESAKVFNRAGDILARHGMKFFYHCHGFEFDPGTEGPDSMAMDILIKETNPKTVAFQMDVLWVFFPGQSPEQWLAKYPGRWELMHLKDYRRGLKTGPGAGKASPDDNVVLGEGQVNWPTVLAAAKKSGVKHYFIEDESAAAADQIPKSLRYLETVKW